MNEGSFLSHVISRGATEPKDVPLSELEKKFKHPFHAPSEMPTVQVKWFGIFLYTDLNNPKKQFFVGDSDSLLPPRLFKETPSLEAQWEEKIGGDMQEYKMIAWSYEIDLRTFFSELFYFTPKPVLNYIDTWSEPTTKTEYKTNA